MTERAAFSVPFGRLIKSTVDRIAATGPSGRGDIRQFSGSAGQFRLAQVIESADSGGSCGVVVYKVRLVVSEFTESLGFQGLVTEELLGAELMAAAPVSMSVALGDIVGVVSWNNRYWVTVNFTSCSIPPPGCCACNAEVTLSDLGGIPSEWASVIAGTHILTPTTMFTTGLCRYILQLAQPTITQYVCADFELIYSPLSLILEINHETNEAELRLRAYRRFVLNPQNRIFEVAWAGSVPDCGVSSQLGNLTELFIEQTPEPSCDAGQETTWQQLTDPQGTPLGCWSWVGVVDNFAECFGWAPDYPPASFDLLQHVEPPQWFFKDLSGVDFSGITASIAWVQCQ